MAIRTRDLRSAWTTSPPLDAIAGGRLAKAHRVMATHAQADKLLGNDRNVIARVGLHGSSAFQVVSGYDPDNFVQLYPLRTVSRVSARVPPFAVLPGHLLRLSALVCPSGLTVKPGPEEGDNFIDDGAYGRIDVNITWTGSPGVVASAYQVLLPASGETWGAEDTAPGAAWAGMRRVEILLMYPESFTTSAADRSAWGERVTASATIAYRGGVRAIDVALQQIPFGYARDIGADTTYSSPLVTDGAGNTVKLYPVGYPIEERSATDPTYGSALLADITDRQHHALGPALMYWTAWDESTTSATATASPSVSTTSTTFVDMLDGSSSAWTEAGPGWSLSAGATAQQFKSSNALRELRGKNACVPVRCWAYCKHSITGAATIRFQTEDYSIADLAVESTTPAWRSCTGHLRAGAHAQDPSVLQVLGKAAAGAELTIYAIFIEYADL